MRPNTSGMGIWFEQEIANLLRAVASSTDSVLHLIPTAEAAIYRAGFEAAIHAMARGFGVEDVISTSRPDDWRVTP